MVRNFNELVLRHAREEDRIDRLAMAKAKQILDEKRERQVGLHRTGELFEPITKRLDIAHAYRTGKRTDEEKKDDEAKEKKKKEERDAANKLIEDALADKFSKEDVKALVLEMGKMGFEEQQKTMNKFLETIGMKIDESSKELLEEDEGAVGGVDNSFQDEYKFPSPGTPSGTSSSHQPMTSTPAPTKIDLGSDLQSPYPSTPPPAYTSEAEETKDKDQPETASGDATGGEEAEAKGSVDWKAAMKELNTRLSRSTAQKNIADGKPPFDTGYYGRLPLSLINEVKKEYEEGKGARNFKSIVKDRGYINIVVASGKDEGKTRYWMKEEDYDTEYSHLDESKRPKTGKRRKNTGSGLNDSLTESEKLKLFAMIKRNIGSINAGNTSIKTVKQTIDAIQLLFLSQEITNQQRTNLLQKLNSAINK